MLERFIYKTLDSKGQKDSESNQEEGNYSQSHTTGEEG